MILESKYAPGNISNELFWLKNPQYLYKNYDFKMIIIS